MKQLSSTAILGIYMHMSSMGLKGIDWSILTVWLGCDDADRHPNIDDIGRALGITPQQVLESFRRLAKAKVVKKWPVYGYRIHSSMFLDP